MLVSHLLVSIYCPKFTEGIIGTTDLLILKGKIEHFLCTICNVLLTCVICS